jgi:phosphomannomutase
MDGTLTPARKKIEKDVINALKALSAYGNICVVTGSDVEYIFDQLSDLIECPEFDNSNLELLPCNGTKRYLYQQGRFQLVHSSDMADCISTKKLNSIMRYCISWQKKVMLENLELPYTGTFIQYRGSLLNWCPIGRAAGDKERNLWVQIDEQKKIREKYVDLLTRKFGDSDITIALGGSTSLDIYPTGWDKTYALKHYGDECIYFVGDSCEKNGNDFQIYEALKKTGRAYATKCPDDTIDIISNMIAEIA